MNDEPKNKAMPSPKTNRRTGEVLHCTRACVIPGLGEFQVGDEVDVTHFDKLADHPFFEVGTDKKPEAK